MTQKAVISSLIILMMFDSFGYMIINLAYDRFLKYEFLMNSSDENNFEIISRISINKSELKRKLRFEEENEFEYNGKMYDVLKTVETKDSIHYYCYCDQKETDFKQNFKTVLNAKTESNRKSLFQLLARTLYPKINTDFSPNLMTINSNSFFCSLQPNPLTSETDTPSPPPKESAGSFNS